MAEREEDDLGVIETIVGLPVVGEICVSGGSVFDWLEAIGRVEKGQENCVCTVSGKCRGRALVGKVYVPKYFRLCWILLLWYVYEGSNKEGIIPAQPEV